MTSKNKPYADAMRDVYKRKVEKLAREIGLPNMAKLDKVTVANAHHVVSEIKARWQAATGGAPLRPEIVAAIEAYVADVRTHTAPLADAVRHELSAAAAGLPTPFEREHQHRKLKRDIARARAQKSHEMRQLGSKGGQAKAEARATALKERNHLIRKDAEAGMTPSEIHETGKYKKIDSMTDDGKPFWGAPLSVDTISHIINTKEG